GVVGAHHADMQAEHVLHAAQVHPRAVLDPLRAEPLADLVRRDDLLWLEALRETDRVAHVVAVGVRDEDGVDAVEVLRTRGDDRVALHPGVDQHDLSSGQVAADRGVTEQRERRARVRVHARCPPKAKMDAYLISTRETAWKEKARKQKYSESGRRL